MVISNHFLFPVLLQYEERTAETKDTRYWKGAGGASHSVSLLHKIYASQR